MLFIIPAFFYYVGLIGYKKLEQTLNKPVMLPVLLFYGNDHNSVWYRCCVVWQAADL